MKNLILLITILTLIISCNNKDEYEKNLATEKAEQVDSINAARKKINDSILILNEKNNYKDLTGNHIFTMASEGISTLSGSVNFTKIDADEYQISGSAKSGKNTIEIAGVGKLITEEFLNFEGEISQNIKQNGGKYTRKGKKTFQAKGKDKFWRLQNMVNNNGFVDYIDIHF